MQINLSEVMLGLDGKALKLEDKDLTVGLALSECLVGGTSPDPLRAYVLAKKLVGAEGEAELDQTESDFLKEAVNANNNYFAIVKGQLLSKFV